MKRIILGGLLGILAACGNSNEESKNRLVDDPDYVKLSNGIKIPRDRISKTSHFMDKEANKEVTAYYFLDKIKTDTDVLAGFFHPPAVYDLGDGHPFSIDWESIIGKHFRYEVREEDIKQYLK